MIDSCAYTLEQSSLAQAEKLRARHNELLRNDPRIGQKADGIRKGLRRHEHESHVIFYPEDGDVVFILAVIHRKIVPIYNSEPSANDRGKRAQPKVRRDLPCNPPNRKPPDV